MKTSKKPKLYFAHPINIYNTALKRKIIKAIRTRFPEYKIIDPENKKHENGYQKEKQRSGNGMKYYIEQILPQCQRCVFLAFRDGMIGAGVFGETKFFFQTNKPIHEINPDTLEFNDNPDFSRTRLLSIEDTRARIRDCNGQIIPY